MCIYIFVIPLEVVVENKRDFSSVQCPTLCDPMNRSMPGFPVHHQLPESTQTHVHCQFIPKEISPEYSLEGLMLKLKLQWFGHLMQRTDSFEKTVMLGKIEGRRRRG